MFIALKSPAKEWLVSGLLSSRRNGAIGGLHALGSAIVVAVVVSHALSIARSVVL